MATHLLIDSIKVAQEKHGNYLLTIIRQFHPLIFKLCALLRYEDAQNDLEYGLIDIVLKIKTDNFKHLGDYAALSYIKKSMYHYYIFLSNRHTIELKATAFSNLTEHDSFTVANVAAIDNSGDRELSIDLQKVLTPHEYDIIHSHYFLGQAISTIAARHGCTRQSINQTKNRAKEKIYQNLYVERAK